MSNFSIRTKMVVGFAIPIILLIAISVVSNNSVGRISAQYSNVATVNLPIVINLEELKFAGLRITSSVPDASRR